MNKKISEVDRWVLVPKALVKDFSRILGVNGIAIYTLLCSYADREYVCKLSYRKISKKFGCTNAEAVRVLHQLEDLHIIKSEPDNSKTMQYRLLWLPIWGKLEERVPEMSEPYRFVLISINNKYDDDGIKKLIINKLWNIIK